MRVRHLLSGVYGLTTTLGIDVIAIPLTARLPVDKGQSSSCLAQMAFPPLPRLLQVNKNPYQDPQDKLCQIQLANC